MRWQDIYVAGVGTDLPPATTVETAIEKGLVEAGRAAELGYRSVLVAEQGSGPEFAVNAGRTAVQRSGIDPAEFGLLLHSYIWFQGRSIWATASYVAAQALSVHVPAYDVLQRCNAGVGALELAASHLTAGTRGSAVLLTTGDRFAAPAIDQWNTHGKAMYGDGGTALVLAKGRGFAKVLSTVTTSDNHFEGMARGTRPLDELPPDPQVPVDLVAPYKEFTAEVDATEIYTRLFGRIHAARDQALEEAGVKIEDVKRVADAATRGGIDDNLYAQLYGFSAEQTSWEFGRRTGHLGAGDQFAGLEDILRKGSVVPGDVVMLFGGGAGFSCTAVVLEIQEVPTF